MTHAAAYIMLSMVFLNTFLDIIGRVISPPPTSWPVLTVVAG